MIELCDGIGYDVCVENPARLLGGSIQDVRKKTGWLMELKIEKCILGKGSMKT